MQRDNFVAKICEIATKFLYLVSKLHLDFFSINFEPCDDYNIFNTKENL